MVLAIFGSFNKLYERGVAEMQRSAWEHLQRLAFRVRKRTQELMANPVVALLFV